MRKTLWLRGISAAMLCAFLLPLLAVAASLSQAGDAMLPACCRIHGKHHCAQRAAHEGGRAVAGDAAHYAATLTERCPCTSTTISFAHLDLSVAGIASSSNLEYSGSIRTFFSQRSRRVKEAVAANPKRGPPYTSPLA